MHLRELSDWQRPDFVHRPLSVPTTLQLLEVLPLQADGIVPTKLSEAPDIRTIPYRCLSYTWGYQSVDLPILVDGFVMKVGRNLYDFLRHAAELFAGRALWIDATCTNQQNDIDKGAQVQHMGSGYRDATEVLLWLGDNP